MSHPSTKQQPPPPPTGGTGKSGYPWRGVTQSTTHPPMPACRPPKGSAEASQVGGSHYATMAIQPMRYSMENGLNACQHTIIEYVSNYQHKNGIEDLEKARHTLDLLIQFERERLADGR